MANIVLASGSKIRSILLKNAGVRFKVQAADIDENKLRQAMAAKPIHPKKMSYILALEKAFNVSALVKSSYVIGADQLLVVQEKIFEKPGTEKKAVQQLLELAGKTHQLWTSCVVVKDGKERWHYTAKASMKLASLSPASVEGYIKRNPQVLDCIGSYQLEGEGIQLFQKIRGDYFSILGLPLHPLILFLKKELLLR